MTRRNSECNNILRMWVWGSRLICFPPFCPRVLFFNPKFHSQSPVLLFHSLLARDHLIIRHSIIHQGYYYITSGTSNERTINAASCYCILNGESKSAQFWVDSVRSANRLACPQSILNKVPVPRTFTHCIGGFVENYHCPINYCPFAHPWARRKWAFHDTASPATNKSNN